MKPRFDEIFGGGPSQGTDAPARQPTGHPAWSQRLLARASPAPQSGTASGASAG